MPFEWNFQEEEIAFKFSVSTWLGQYGEILFNPIGIRNVYL